MKGIEKSVEIFLKEERGKYGAIEITIENAFSLLEFRRNAEKKLCIIELLKNGKGYRIYELKASNVEEREIFKPRQGELNF